MNVAERLIEVDQRPAGFDYIRLVLAISVLCFHTVIVCYGRDADVAMWISPWGLLVRQILPMFFALSGFLVAGSLIRSRTLWKFLWLRLIRIYPALTVEVLLSALLIGPMVTTLAIADYFSSSIFSSYMWNVIGHIHFFLPGVFEENPLPGTVNAQLWTVPFELYCYASLAAIGVLGAKTRRWLAPTAAALLLLAYCVGRYIKHAGFPPIDGGVTGPLLIVSFLVGVSIYNYKDMLPFSKAMFAASIVLSIASARHFHYGILILPITSAYAVVYLGLLNPQRTLFLKGADYSYGIFLYGFVIQQLIASTGTFGQIWFINLPLSLILTSLIAAVSWNFIELPAMRLRNFQVGRGQLSASSPISNHSATNSESKA